MSKRVGFTEVLTTKIVRRKYTAGFCKSWTALDILQLLKSMPPMARLIEVDADDEESDITQLTFVDESEANHE